MVEAGKRVSGSSDGEQYPSPMDYQNTTRFELEPRLPCLITDTRRVTLKRFFFFQTMQTL